MSKNGRYDDSDNRYRDAHGRYGDPEDGYGSAEDGYGDAYGGYGDADDEYGDGYDGANNEYGDADDGYGVEDGYAGRGRGGNSGSPRSGASKTGASKSGKSGSQKNGSHSSGGHSTGGHSSGGRSTGGHSSGGHGGSGRSSGASAGGGHSSSVRDGGTRTSSKPHGDSSRGSGSHGGGHSTGTQGAQKNARKANAAVEATSKGHKRKKSARKRRRVFLLVLEIAALVVLCVAIWGVTTVTKMDRIEINEEDIVVNINENVEENEVLKGYRNIALFGVDSRKGRLGKGQRSDTIIIASVNMDTKEVRLCSVYRDSYLNLGDDSYNKANSAYASGGPEQALIMLNRNFDLNLTEYMTVGFDALIEVIDALGGVTIDVQESEIDHLNNYQRSMFMEEGDPASKLNDDIVPVTSPGVQTLSGLQATAYCRIRYVGDDYMRTERQRRVLMACLDKAKKANPLTLVNIMNSVLENVATNLDVNEMTEILQDAASYTVKEQTGMPFESDRWSGRLGSKGSCIVPDTLEDNVVELHRFLFDVENYQPSEEVVRYSDKIRNDTAQYH